MTVGCSLAFNDDDDDYNYYNYYYYYYYYYYYCHSLIRRRQPLYFSCGKGRRKHKVKGKHCTRGEQCGGIAE